MDGTAMLSDGRYSEEKRQGRTHQGLSAGRAWDQRDGRTTRNAWLCHSWTHADSAFGPFTEVARIELSTPVHKRQRSGTPRPATSSEKLYVILLNDDTLVH